MYVFTVSPPITGIAYNENVHKFNFLGLVSSETMSLRNETVTE